MSTIETNKLIRQEKTVDCDYVAPVGDEGSRHKIPAKVRKSGKSSDSACAHHCLLPFFRKLSFLLMNCGIYFAYIPGITIPGITFLIPRLNNGILSPCELSLG